MDKLTSYNSSTISYDAIGNPTGDGTWTYTWEKGRQLKQMTKSGTTVAFAYNVDGLRVRKTVNGVATNYILHGKNIVHMTQGTDTLHFWYDAQGRPAIVEYNGTKYAYIHNLQGDIVGIIDSTGAEVVQYTYDAWGKVLSTAGTMASTLGTVQPFRYRGYVYDAETGLYYLRSRYYNPEWGRFINADSLIKGNLYCYCENNPIILLDTTGNFIETFIDIISVGYSIFDVIRNPSDPGAWIGLGLDVLDLIPYVTGSGESYRAYKLIENTIDGLGDLSKAKDYGIMGYKALKKKLKGTGLQAHHIIEKRLVTYLGINADDMLSVAVTAAEHQKFTNAWRDAIAYGSDYTKLTKEVLWDYAQIIYKDYPDLIDAARTILGQ